MSELRASKLVTVAVLAGFLAVLAALAWTLRRRQPKVSVGPIFALAGFLEVGLYALGSTVDQVAALVGERVTTPAESFVERALLGWHDALAPLLPLGDRPLVAAPMKVGAALGLYLALVQACWFFGRAARLDPELEDEHPVWRGIYALAGYRDLRVMEERYRGWMGPLLLVAPLGLFVVFFELFPAAGQRVSLLPFLYGLAVACVAGAAVNLLFGGVDAPAAEAAPRVQDEARAPGSPAAWVAALRGAGFELPAQGTRWGSARAAEAAAGTSSAMAGPLLGELVAGLCRGRDLYAHQREALERLRGDGRRVLLQAPPRAGKTTVAWLAAAERALAEGRNTLVVARDAETATEGEAHLRGLLAGTAWRHNLRSTLAGPELVRLLAEQRSPVLAFADPDALDRLLSTPKDSAYFLELLGLVVVEDLERHSGLRGANLSYLTRRLWAVLARLRGAPRLLATVGEPVCEVARHAEELLGAELELVVGASGPTRPLALHAGQAPGQAVVGGAARALAEAAALGLPATVLGFAALSRAQLAREASAAGRSGVSPVPLEDAAVGVVELAATHAARLSVALTHFGAWSEGSSDPTAVLLVRPEPVAAWIATDLRRLERFATLGRTLVAERQHVQLGTHHLHQALLAAPVDEVWARQVFGAEVVEAARRDGLFVARETRRLEREPLGLATRGELCLREAAGSSRASAETVGSSPVEVVDQATGTVLRRLDAARAPLVAFPGAVLHYRGQRYVLPWTPGRYEPGERLAAALLDEELMGVRVRELKVSLEQPELLRPLSLGGATLEGGLVSVAVEERITATRHHGPTGALRTLVTFAPIEVRYRSLARVLTTGGEASEAALHALVHLLRNALEALFDCGEEGLHLAHTTELAGRGPALLCLDTFPGGAGYARALELGRLREALSLVRELLDGACCDGAGCPRCVRTLHCHQMEPERATLDRAGARALVDRLIGA
ncbi:MAG: DUF1998 domain-containing protein [Deltaproteobacteria bacterium]|nr:DUF1998 domain-containing protein [Deltaproteobacteria bacterium]